MLDTNEIKYADGIVEIFGIKYDIEMFRGIACLPIGEAVLITERSDGVVCLKKLVHYGSVWLESAPC